MDPVQRLEEVFAEVRALPEDKQFIAWNSIMDWLQSAVPDVAMFRRVALHKYRKNSGLTRRELADQFGLTFTTVSRLMDEADKTESELTKGS